jgi:hypothetical protein
MDSQCLYFLSCRISKMNRRKQKESNARMMNCKFFSFFKSNIDFADVYISFLSCFFAFGGVALLPF